MRVLGKSLFCFSSWFSFAQIMEVVACSNTFLRVGTIRSRSIRSSSLPSHSNMSIMIYCKFDDETMRSMARNLFQEWSRCKGSPATGMPRTLITLRNIPKFFSRDDVMEVLRARGVLELINFVYMAVKIKKTVGGTIHNLGYVTLNAVSSSAIETCKDRIIWLFDDNKYFWPNDWW